MASGLVVIKATPKKDQQILALIGPHNAAHRNWLTYGRGFPFTSILNMKQTCANGYGKNLPSRN
jgi:hypothetical protein